MFWDEGTGSYLVHPSPELEEGADNSPQNTTGDIGTNSGTTDSSCYLPDARKIEEEDEIVSLGKKQKQRRKNKIFSSLGAMIFLFSFPPFLYNVQKNHPPNSFFWVVGKYHDNLLSEV